MNNEQVQKAYLGGWRDAFKKLRYGNLYWSVSHPRVLTEIRKVNLVLIGRNGAVRRRP